MKGFIHVVVLSFVCICSYAQKQPVLFGEGIISGRYDELNACFTKDGKRVFFTINAVANRFAVIVYSDLVNGKWTAPKVASFSGQYTDYDPFISPDGEKLFFISNRPVDGKARTDFDIYVVDKKGDDWSEARNLGAPVNDEKNQFYPAVAANGNLYYNTNKETSFDLYVSKWTDGHYQAPEKLKGGLNTPNTTEGDACISPDERFIIFASYGRSDSFGSGDLYISYNQNGEWTEAKNLGAVVNTATREYCPILSPDGKTFYFTSFKGQFDTPIANRFERIEDVKKVFDSILNGAGNVYQLDTSELVK